MDASSRRDWAAFEPAQIPSKTAFPQLDGWLDQLRSRGAERVLDLGCGAGIVSRAAFARGFSVVGVDINHAAIDTLQRELPHARFYERDIASADGLALPEEAFDAVICQLVVSVVGDADDRSVLLRNARELLRPGGELFLSASGLSDDLNPEYAALYARDVSETGEHGSYVSRDASGRALYTTHHFGRNELTRLLDLTGFHLLALDEQVEVSSRRPDQRARFFYLTAQRTDRSPA